MKTLKKIAKYILISTGLHSGLIHKRNLIRSWRLQRRRMNSILEYKKIFNYDTFVETGTYKGDMVELMRKRFKKIYSIEIGDQLFSRACQRFRTYDHITIMHGDSTKVLPIILSKLHRPAIFWLDAHDSGGDTARGEIITPIEQELDAIMHHPIKNHVILIDDARDFTGHGGYPSADKIKRIAQKHNYNFEIKDDNIRLFPSVSR